ncbi:MAG: hypothetical protein E7022_07165 [Desulfovibrio desulfuricans]|nr:hypothetical protein [Desulfovibrio desulfuricans]
MKKILVIVAATVIGSAGLCGIAVSAPGDGGHQPMHMQNQGDRGHMQIFLESNDSLFSQK